MQPILKHYKELSADEMHRILQLRAAVFVVEQKCAFLDPDDKDRKGYHLFYSSDKGDILAYARILGPGISYPSASIGRLCIHANERGNKLGYPLFLQAINSTMDLYPGESIEIQAQYYLEKFYQKFGFITTSDIYLEDDIEHVQMIMNAPSSHLKLEDILASNKQ